jgi:hypothetical protein
MRGDVHHFTVIESGIRDAIEGDRIRRRRSRPGSGSEDA